MNSVDKGRIAEAKVVAELVAQGYEVYLPTFGNGVCDLIASSPAGKLTRVETKYVSARAPGTTSSWLVSLRQVRANRATMIVKKFNGHQCDVLAVYVAPLDRVLFFAAAPLHGRTGLNVRAEMVATHGEMAEW